MKCHERAKKLKIRRGFDLIPSNMENRKSAGILAGILYSSIICV